MQIIEDLEPIAKTTTYKKVRYLEKEDEIEVVRKSLMLAARQMNFVESETMSIS